MGPGAVVVIFLFVVIFVFCVIGFSGLYDPLNLRSLFDTTVTDAVDCEGTWSDCIETSKGSTCMKTLKVTQVASGTGAASCLSKYKVKDGGKVKCVFPVTGTGGDCTVDHTKFAKCSLGNSCKRHIIVKGNAEVRGENNADCKKSFKDGLCNSKCATEISKSTGGVRCNLTDKDLSHYLMQVSRHPDQLVNGKCRPGWTLMDASKSTLDEAKKGKGNACGKFIETDKVDKDTGKCLKGYYIQKGTGKCVKHPCPKGSGGWNANVQGPNKALVWEAVPRELAWSGTPLRMACDIKPWVITGGTNTVRNVRTLFCDGGGCNQDPVQLAKSHGVDAKCGHTIGCKSSAVMSDGLSYGLDRQYHPCPLDPARGGGSTLKDNNWEITENRYWKATGDPWIEHSDVNTLGCSGGCGDSGFRLCVYNPTKDNVGGPHKIKVWGHNA